MNKLQDFLKQYEIAANSRDFSNVAPLIADDAVFWFTNGTYEGRQSIRKAFEDTWLKIKDEKYTISNVEWLVVKKDVAICTYRFKSDGIVDGQRQIYEGRGTNVLTKHNEIWQLTHEHLSNLPEG